MPIRLLVLALLLFPLTASAETHRLIPTQFFNTFSGAHAPVLRIKSGDRVITKTIDAAGVDWDGKTVGRGPNPQTGPFYIEGAEAGDTLIVTIEKLETNRATAYSSSLLAPYTVDPATLAARVDREPKRAIWTIDKARGVAFIDTPEITASRIELPLRPMLGCIATAPARSEAIATSTPGAHGGNMDYALLGAGVKVLLPVNEPGALLFLGDGHARQGMGEVVGTGLETSLDVEFSVELVKKKTIQWPRLETDTLIMVLGSARPLIEALQHATSEMQRWLVADYGMTERAAATLMGQALEYDIANVVDPNFTVVAKLQKSLLRAK